VEEKLGTVTLQGPGEKEEAKSYPLSGFKEVCKQSSRN
jgi:hypothetical protein